MASNQVLTLKKRSEFVTIKKQGRRAFQADWLIINYKENSLNINRFGWTIPRYVGNAVVRNKIRRWFREFFRKNRINHSSSLDINLILKKKSKDFYKTLTYEDFEKSLQALNKKIKRQSR